MGRWDPRPLPGDRADDDPVRLSDAMGDIDDIEDAEETRAIAGAHVARLDAQLRTPPTDPALLARLQRDRAYWQGLIEATTIDDHWHTGAGDRTLF